MSCNSDWNGNYADSTNPEISKKLKLADRSLIFEEENITTIYAEVMDNSIVVMKTLKRCYFEANGLRAYNVPIFGFGIKV